MAPKMRWTRSKRLLQEYKDENHNVEREVQEISNDQNVIGSISETGTAVSSRDTAVSGRDEDHQIHPRSRRASELRMRKRDRHLDTQYSVRNDDTSRFQHCRQRFISSQQSTVAISNQSFSGDDANLHIYNAIENSG